MSINQQTLDYATADAIAPPGPWLWRATLVCGLLPMTVGIADILVWLVSPDSWTIDVGLLTLLAGPFVVFVGFVCAVIYAVRQARARVAMRAWLLTLACFCALFLANFAAAIACLAISSRVPPKQRLTVVNAGSADIQSVVFLHNGTRMPLGPLGPGKDLTHAWRQRSSNLPQIEFTYAGGQPQYALIDDYFDFPQGRRIRLSIQPALVKKDYATTRPATQPFDETSVRN